MTCAKSRWWKEVLGFEGFFMVDAVGQSGGLLLLWRLPISVDVLSFSLGHVDCLVMFRNVRWRFTGFYGHPKANERHFSWTLLKRLSSLHEIKDLPWVVGGDFNEIAFNEEKQGGKRRAFGQMEAFREALTEGRLEDFFSKDATFTWQKNPSGKATIAERLDRFVMNIAWMDAFPMSRLETMDNYGSDHRAIVLRVIPGATQVTGKGTKRFHFEQKWFLDESFVEDFVMEWKELRGCDLPARLRQSKEFLKRWAGLKFDDLGKQIVHLRKERVRLLNLQHGKDISTELQRISARIEELTTKEEIHWRQRSRVNWLAHGDRNTQYFHNHASERKKRNHIRGLYNKDGIIVSKDEEIAHVVQDYYCSLFTTASPNTQAMSNVAQMVRKVVPRQHKGLFDEAFTADEIKRALFQMHPTKAPGPDGFQAVFYQKLWGEVGRDVTSECLRILNEGADIAHWNETYITLVPKIDNPQEVRNFRPISLCNTTYKVISKVVVNRLRRWLPFVIDETQSAFVPGRLISDNIMVGFECLNWIRRQRNPNKAYVAAKLDMSKAYDRVEWPFLKMMMEAMGFGDKVISLIMRCVSTVTYSFVINGKVYGKVVPTRGIRQGDPLSPFLFVICAQGLSSILNAYMDQQLFAGIKVARRAPVVSHLFFADDSLLLFDANGDGPDGVLRALKLYSEASGQLINYDKSSLTFSPGAHHQVVARVKRLFGVQVAQGHSIYLGLPTFMMREKRLQFDFLKERVSRRLRGWQNKVFSTGGKETLIKSVIQSIPTYTMSCFKVPVTICNDIERMCAKFWWGDKEDERKLHWSTWRNLCKPKSRGGMGFRDIMAFNKALLAKQLWRLIRFPDSLVANIFRAKYYSSDDIMEAKVSCNASFIWRSLLWSRDLLKKGLRWKIGRGDSVRVFKDAWLPEFTEGHTISRPMENENMRVEELMSSQGTWDRDKMEKYLLPVEVEEICRIDCDKETRDRRYWRHDPKGEYSVKSGYLEATGYYSTPERSDRDGMVGWWKFLWSFDLPQRIRIFVWRVFSNILPTEINLLAHHVPTGGLCGWCQKGWGTTSHALLFCGKVRERWKAFTFWSHLKVWEGREIGDIGERMKNAVTREEFAEWLMGMWLIWKELCEEKHEKKMTSSRNLPTAVGILLQNYQDAQQQAALLQKVLPREGENIWRKPRSGRYRLDVDYGEVEGRDRAGVGAILRDDEGRVVFAMAKPVSKSNTVLMGELRAIVYGIYKCIEEEICPVEVFTDSLLAVHVLAEEDGAKSVLCEELFKAFAAAKEICVLSVNHVRREANEAAHALATFAKNSETMLVWSEILPSWLVDVVLADVI